jgi:DNA-binding MarR family transcriptional regulator
MMVSMTEPAVEDALARVERSFHKLGAISKQAARAQSSQAHPEMRPAGWIVFRVVSMLEPVPVADIIAETGMDKSVVSRQLKSLREWGLIEVGRHVDDARVVVVRTSELGRQRADAVRSVLRSRYRTAFESWDEHDVETLADLLERLVPAVDSPLLASESDTP